MRNYFKHGTVNHLLACLAVSLIVALVLPRAALAGPPNWKKSGYDDDDNDQGRGHGRGHDKDHGPGNRDNNPGHGYGRSPGNGPPPWAPAHGYRYKSGDEYQRSGYREPFRIAEGRCNTEAIGTVVGGALGGLAGSKIGKGDGRIIAILGGTVLGAIVGGSIGRSMDAVDQTCVSQTMEHARDDQTVRWRSETGKEYEVTPTKTFQTSSGGYCREYLTRSIIGGKTNMIYGRACRDNEGVWRIMR